MDSFVRFIPKSIIPRLGGKHALIEPLSQEVRLCLLDSINPCDTYIEPFMGGARIFLNCPMPQNVVLNEYDKNITSLFRVIQRGGSDLDQLIHELQSAAYCQENFEEAKVLAAGSNSSEVERAMAAYILAKQSILNCGEGFKWYSENDSEKGIKNREYLLLDIFMI